MSDAITANRNLFFIISTSLSLYIRNSLHYTDFYFSNLHSGKTPLKRLLAEGDIIKGFVHLKISCMLFGIGSAIFYHTSHRISIKNPACYGIVTFEKEREKGACKPHTRFLFSSSPRILRPLLLPLRRTGRIPRPPLRQVLKSA